MKTFMNAKDKLESNGKQKPRGELPPKDWNNTRAEYPRSKCIHQLFEEQVQRTPEAVAHGIRRPATDVSAIE